MKYNVIHRGVKVEEFDDKMEAVAHATALNIIAVESPNLFDLCGLQAIATVEEVEG